jgi:RHS repeat-associated protein
MENGQDEMNYILKDHLGSIHFITDENGNPLEELGFDAWGNRRNPQTWTKSTLPQSFKFDRGFTLHEHLDEFGLINMNGRMYDPWLGRFLSPDNFVQVPGNLQNFNRYSYCLNNPLIYTDPSGEVYLWDDVIVAAAGFVLGYVSYGLTNDDWGWSAVGAGAIGAGTALLGYYTFGGGWVAGEAATCSAELSIGLNYVGSMAINTVASQIIPPMNIQVSNNVSVSVSPAFALGPDGLVGGANFTVVYTNGDVQLAGSVGTSTKGNSVSGGVTWYDRANNEYFSYYATYFGGDYKQTVGGIGYGKGDFSFRWENDFFANSGDKYRTNAIEFGYGDFVVGTNLWTNDPEGDGSLVDPNGKNLRGKTSKSGAWVDGQVLSAPAYVGYRQGNSITRVGLSNPWVQDRTQNFIHKNVNPTPFFNKYDRFRGGAWSYSGYNNPFTLY